MNLINRQMLDYIKELLTSKANGASLILFVLTVFVSVSVVIGFVKLVKFCFAIESNNERSAHTLIKTVLIAFIPTIYSILSALNIADIIPFYTIIILTTGISIAVAIWNVISFGIICGIMFTVMHIVFGVLASLGIGAFVLIAVAMVVLMLFGGAVGGGSTDNSSSVHEYVRNSNTGEMVAVEKGANGELYIMGTSNVLRSSDYSGRYFDDNGNQYISC